MGSNVALAKFLDVPDSRMTLWRALSGMFGSGSISEASAKDKSGTAIGYSYRYFIKNSSYGEDIKMLSIGGVAPSPENIKNKTYPLSGEFIAVTRADNTNPNVGLLMDFMIGREGQELVEKTGYIGLTNAA
jgi:phosphate transport system substrate-binding protein